MIDLISTAHAESAAAPAQGGGFVEIGILVFFFAIFYLMIWRPQSKRAAAHRDLISSLGKGDEVVLNSGMLGKISELDEQYVTVKIADNVMVRFQRQAVSQVLPKGTIKSIA